MTESAWTWRDKLVYRLTGRVSARIYAERVVGLALVRHPANRLIDAEAYLSSLRPLAVTKEQAPR